jgi:hypothetical protein
MTHASNSAAAVNAAVKQTKTTNTDTITPSKQGKILTQQFSNFLEVKESIFEFDEDGFGIIPSHAMHCLEQGLGRRSTFNLDRDRYDHEPILVRDSRHTVDGS